MRAVIVAPGKGACLIEQRLDMLEVAYIIGGKDDVRRTLTRDPGDFILAALNGK
jgi:hypothetical protein